MARIPLFDLGNVVIRVDFSPFLAWLAERSETKSLEHASAVLRSSLFYDLEFGSIGREHFRERLALLYRASFSQFELEQSFCGIFPGPVEGMEEWLLELSSAGPVYALSNTNEVHLEWLKREYPGLMGKFTRVFASHEIGARKPYPGIYRKVAEELQCRPEEIVFFDDLPANVEGARKAGLEAYLFSDTLRARAVLK
jgi:HAD superfamily hydrolase (TIGR01509 family)